MFRMPKFTIAGLLWLTVAVALGFAISQGPAPEGGSSWDSSLWFRFHWQVSLLLCGAVMVLFALVQQGRKYLSAARTAEKPLQFSFRLQVVICFGLAGTLSAILVLHFLINRQIIAEFSRIDRLYLYDDLWGSLVLQLVLFASLQQFQVGRSIATPRSFYRTTLNLLVIGGSVALLAWILTGKTTITMLVHVAINQVEISRPSWLQRSSAFPNHVVEGYWCFWTSVCAIATAGLTALLLVRDGTMKGGKGRLGLRTLIVASLGGLAGYGWWFFTIEFPRINPDFAAGGSASGWSETLAGVLLCIGTSVGLACWNSARFPSGTPAPSIPTGATLVPLGALLVGLAASWPMVVELGSLPNWLNLSFGIALVELGQAVGEMIIWPEVLIPLALIVCAFTVAWHTVWHPEARKLVPVIEPDRFAFQLLGWTLLLVLAIPALAAYSMCYWLGPFVLGF